MAKVSSAPKQQVTLSYSMGLQPNRRQRRDQHGPGDGSHPRVFKLKKPADNLLRCQVYTSSQLTVEGKMKTTLVS